jgi:hypothetical protein
MKIGVFLENQCYDKLLLLKSSILSQNWHVFPKFLPKILKNIYHWPLDLRGQRDFMRQIEDVMIFKYFSRKFWQSIGASLSNYR